MQARYKIRHDSLVNRFDSKISTLGDQGILFGSAEVTGKVTLSKLEGDFHEVGLA